MSSLLFFFFHQPSLLNVPLFFLFSFLNLKCILTFHNQVCSLLSFHQSLSYHLLFLFQNQGFITKYFFKYFSKYQNIISNEGVCALSLSLIFLIPKMHFLLPIVLLIFQATCKCKYLPKLKGKFSHIFFIGYITEKFRAHALHRSFQQYCIPAQNIKLN